MRAVILINGKPRTGKDTFCYLSKEIVDCPVFSLSSVNCVREIFGILDIEETKTEKQRGQMSELKAYLSKWNVPNLDIIDRICKIASQHDDFIVFVHVREPENIINLKSVFSKYDPMLRIFECKTLLLKRDTDGIFDAKANNDSDNNVDDYDYDVVIENNGSLDDLKEQVHKFCYTL
jgi:hypothetical protein